MSKRFVLSGYFGFKNFGDEAILSVLVNKLNQSNHHITIISSNPDYTKSQYKNIKSVYTFDIPNIIGAIAKSDVLVSGGGSLLQDVTSVKSLFYYLFVIFIGQLLHKKTVIFAQGITYIKNPVGRFLTKVLLKNCTYVSVRDEKSRKLLSDWGIDSDLLCDPVFSVEIPKNTKNNVVAVQLRNFRTFTQDFSDRLAHAVVSNFADKKIEIYSFQDSIDLEVCQDFENKLKLLNPDIKTEVFSELTNEEIISNISKAEYLIAMRFHAIIAGLVAGAKVLAINYDTKVEKIANEFNLPVIDLKKDFRNQFEELKCENTDKNFEICAQKSFDWTNFNRMVE